MAKKSNVKGRIRDFLIAHVGEVLTRQQIQEAARDPTTGKIPENWHQRLSELRVDEGYDILSWRDRNDLKPGQYELKSVKPSRIAKPREYLSKEEREELFTRDDRQCQWIGCALREGDKDPIGGGTVVLTADHKSPHSLIGGTWKGTIEDWQTLCARHQQEKKNLIDDRTGRKNVLELVRVSSKTIKQEVYEFLKSYFEKP